MTTVPLLRRLPAVDRLLSEPALADVIALYGRALVTVQARRELDALRRDIRSGTTDQETLSRRLDGLAGRIAGDLHRRLGGLRRVINATGIFVHTNLGRAPLPAEVMAEVAPLLSGYCDLEMSLDTGRRAERNRRASALLEALCGTQAALVTNNNAAAMVLALTALARGREVIVSRGELVEIGGSFRIPDILEASGATLVEVGTTNRTRVDDYRRAITPETALLLKVHPSNYRIIGFTEEASAAELASLGREVNVPVFVDEGSGLILDDDRPQMRDHDSLKRLLDVGVHLVCGSGDKVLGGPQAGLLLGDADLVKRCRKHPLYRAVRPDGFTFSTLEAVLRRRLAGKPMPLDRLWPEPEVHRTRLGRFAEKLAALGLSAELIDASAYLGGGAGAERPIAGQALALDAGESVLAALRRGEPAVLGYVREDRLILDLRTVEPEDETALADAVGRAFTSVRRIGDRPTADPASEGTP
ncbi:MAG: L-seryl-tRNA(Sec) selenium transferase [Acidobacteriota bacterium]